MFWKKWTQVRVKDLFKLIEQYDMKTHSFTVKAEIKDWLDEYATGTFFRKWRVRNGEFVLFMLVMLLHNKKLPEDLIIEFKDARIATMFKITFL